MFPEFDPDQVADHSYAHPGGPLDLNKPGWVLIRLMGTDDRIIPHYDVKIALKKSCDQYQPFEAISSNGWRHSEWNCYGLLLPGQALDTPGLLAVRVESKTGSFEGTTVYFSVRGDYASICPP